MDAQWISFSKEFGWKFKNVYAGYVERWKEEGLVAEGEKGKKNLDCPGYSKNSIAHARKDAITVRMIEACHVPRYSQEEQLLGYVKADALFIHLSILTRKSRFVLFHA